MSEAADEIRLASRAIRLRCEGLVDAVLDDSISEEVAYAVDALLMTQIRCLELEQSLLEASDATDSREQARAKETHKVVSEEKG